ncbi:hypothetical protein [Aquimarina algicola]|uniref:Lipoprotein n=1 Tax=Aquimarina algicola TaxID=2589995 RepID=A0A504JQ11_9FLAO|nr:hypothetical protein [Aquimarina algicola]TPN88851.1 hypothetical protein FHK87_01155 [Aquimarina algicola]
MRYKFIFILPLLYILSCSSDNSPNTDNSSGEENSNTENPDSGEQNNTLAEVTKVFVSGNENNYSFSVEIKSPDTGCDQYANWWEVISEDGELIFRRILGHSHVNEQPFSRSGSPVAISKNQIVYVRAHMNNSGYGNVVFKGSVETGFEKSTLESSFASNLENVSPLPQNCAF